MSNLGMGCTSEPQHLRQAEMEENGEAEGSLGYKTKTGKWGRGERGEVGREGFGGERFYSK